MPTCHHAAERAGRTSTIQIWRPFMIGQPAASTPTPNPPCMIASTQQRPRARLTPRGQHHRNKWHTYRFAPCPTGQQQQTVRSLGSIPTVAQPPTAQAPLLAAVQNRRLCNERPDHGPLPTDPRLPRLKTPHHTTATHKTPHKPSCVPVPATRQSGTRRSLQRAKRQVEVQNPLTRHTAGHASSAPSHVVLWA